MKILTLSKVAAIVTRPKGSWRWQDAFAVSFYKLQWSPRMGRFIWRLSDRTAKMTWPRAVRVARSQGTPWCRSVPDPISPAITLESHPLSPYNQDY